MARFDVVPQAAVPPGIRDPILEEAERARLIACDGLFTSEGVGLHLWRCQVAEGGLGPLRRRARYTLAFVHRGAFGLHVGRREHLIDPLSVAVFAPPEPYRISHPAGCGDRGSALLVADDWLRGVLEEIDPVAAAREELRIPFSACALSPSTRLRYHRLVARLRGGVADPLEAEESALAIVASILSAGLSAEGMRSPRPPASGPRSPYVARALTAMAVDFHRPLSLTELARRAYVSPFHLCRVFRQQTGLPVHRYLVRLRLQAALEAMTRRPDQDLVAIAAGVGFATHSHFTAAFRREFGTTPSAVRQGTRGGAGSLACGSPVSALALDQPPAGSSSSHRRYSSGRR